MSPADHIHQTMCVCFYLCVIIVANIRKFNVKLCRPIYTLSYSYDEYFFQMHPGADPEI